MFKDTDIKFVDKVLSKMVGWDIGAGHRSYQRYLNKFTQAINHEVFGFLYKWFFDDLIFDNYTLDFDSTVMVREGEQEGAAKGYNPKRPGRNSHHPLMAFVSDIRMIANYWLKPRRIVMVRQEIEKRPDAAGKMVKQLCLFEDQSDYGKCRCSCFVTNLNLQMKVVYDSYRGRAGSENRIKELKSDFAVDSFVTHNFWVTEACGNFIMLAYNFFSLFRHALVNSPKKSFLKTIRYELINTPAYFAKSKDKHILYLARSMKTRYAFQGIWSALDHFNLPYKV